MSSSHWPFGPRCRVCVSVAEPDVERLLQRVAGLAGGVFGGADLVEVRLDALEHRFDAPDELAERIVAASSVPVGFTLRPAWHGGGYEGDEFRRREILQGVAAAGAAFVDVELDADWAPELISGTTVPVVLSHHWYEPGVPGDLERRVARARELGAAVVKLVATAAAPDDAVPLLEAGVALVAGGQAATCFCMGEAGRSSRLLAAASGAALLYAAEQPGGEVAPGQWSVAELVDELRVPHWRPGGELYGLIGDPIGHSLSPAIFNAVFHERDRSAAYVPLHGADLDAVLQLAAATGVRGVSVTMPFKREMAARSSARDALVEATGAANTVLFEESGWSAYNTDGQAVVGALAAARSPAGARVALLGAGGAARAAAVALTGAGCRVTVLNRTVERAARLADEIGAGHGAPEALRQQHFDVVINATPVGMEGTPHAGEAPFPATWLRGDETVFDMVYRPRHTPLLRQAAEAGCTVVEGLEMFVRQAAAQYRLLTGDPGETPLASMRKTADRMMGQDMH